MSESVDKHCATVVDSFSNLQSYKQKVEHADGGLWMDRYRGQLQLFGELMWDRNRRLVELASGGKRILDLGCGMGDVMVAVAEKYEELYGIDPCSDFCEQARQVLPQRTSKPIRIDMGVCEQLDYEDGFFDTAAMLDVYEHVELEWRAAALKEAARVLRPGGELFVATPVRGVLRFWTIVDNLLMLPINLWRRQPIQIWSFSRKNHTEIFCSKSELLFELAAAGFEVTHFERVGFYPAPEREGAIGILLNKLKPTGLAYRAIGRIFKLAGRLGFLRQKMLVRAVVPPQRDA